MKSHLTGLEPELTRLNLCRQVIRVPSDFDARDGLKLTPDYTVGKEIGGGVQGRVLTLNRPDGEKTDKLLKVQCLSTSEFN